jgi:hypothetical protein
MEPRVEDYLDLQQLAAELEVYGKFDMCAVTSELLLVYKILFQTFFSLFGIHYSSK